MNTNTLPRLTGYAPLKKLRIALAISQGAKLLSVLQQETEATVSHDQTKRVTYLTGLFFRIHREMFHHWKEQASVLHRPGTMPNADKRLQFRTAVARLVLENGTNRDSAIFDSNGFVFRTENIAERLANFYMTMRTIRPFDYGNRLTLDFFMTVLGKLPAFKSVYEQGIDFRRLEVSDAAALHNTLSSCTEVTRALQHAMDPNRCKSLPNQPNGYGRWPENKILLSGIPFLSHTTADGVACLVAVNGGLMPLEKIQKELFLAGKHLADYPLCAAENILGYLPGTEALRAPGKTAIDGISIAANGAAPLFCLDINMVSGLRSPSHTELMELLKQCAGNQTSIFTLAGNEALRDKMLAAADDDPRLQRSVEIAYERLGKITTLLDTALAAIFQGKAPVQQPRMFMSMGGAGAGKTAVEEIAQAQCGDNFVIASLDEFRKQSDLYQVLTAAKHHSDDYVYVEPFANRLRDMVADYARIHGINILYDGTGIPYSPRYSAIIEQFRQAGFYTQIVAVDAFLVKPAGREGELLRSTVIGSVKQRYAQTGRALPWVVTVYKHIHAPEAFLNALEHQALDKISLFANDGERDKHYLVAESFICTEAQVQALQEHQKAGRLAAHFKALFLNRDDSLLHALAAGDSARINALIARNPAFDESNVAYQIYPGKENHRVLAIYHTGRMVDFVEKRQLNPHASGEEGLLHIPAALAFHVDPHAKEAWITRLQGSLAR